MFAIVVLFVANFGPFSCAHTQIELSIWLFLFSLGGAYKADPQGQCALAITW